MSFQNLITNFLLQENKELPAFLDKERQIPAESVYSLLLKVDVLWPNFRRIFFADMSRLSDLVMRDSLKVGFSNIHEDRRVCLFRTGSRDGFYITIPELIEYADYIWHPGGDDIYLMSADAHWIVRLDHEEMMEIRLK